MKIEKYIADPFFEKRIINYDKWLSKGQISASSKVIPVSESFNAKQWVLPAEQVMEILTNANSEFEQKSCHRSIVLDGEMTPQDSMGNKIVLKTDYSCTLSHPYDKSSRLERINTDFNF